MNVTISQRNHTTQPVENGKRAIAQEDENEDIKQMGSVHTFAYSIVSSIPLDIERETEN